ncbi:Uncharacterised protein [Streptococcus pneumoniae]|nr:Uncharacterised protein [Streptococcus pneumoniae]CJA38495.1 Uncharacterised protein [Streptococcus pneumoniae]CJB06900.1 Uncharacterised protein [Streptococcus pneumoniae]CJG25755.1 Uncharacterised protein [Streptococcus pneumoniae]CJH08517.1 Uncharacterised protein [Streptococcus pneumoniae]
MNENSIGSVIPVKNEVNARPANIPVTALRFSGLAAAIIAKHAAGKPNIITGKKPVINIPAVLSPARKRAISPLTTLPAAFVKSPNTNQKYVFITWCKPIGINKRFNKPNNPEPIAPKLTIP